MNIRDYIKLYNQRVFPNQIVLFFPTLMILFLLFFKSSSTSILLVKCLLIYSFLFIAFNYAFHFKEMIEEFPLMIGIQIICFLLFILISASTFVTSPIQVINVSISKNWISIFTVIWALVFYEIVGIFLTKDKFKNDFYLRVGFFGIFSCPTVLFTIGIFSFIPLNLIDSIIMTIASLYAFCVGLFAGIIGFGGVRVAENLIHIPIAIYGLYKVYLFYFIRV